MAHKYLIDTGDIFDKLQFHWENYDRKFLISIENPLSQILKQNKIVTRSYDIRIEHYHDIIYPKLLKLATQKENFPFPNFFLDYYISKKGFDIIAYYESCRINKNNKYFDLFFALKLSLTDIMEASEFLKYHLENSFENDFLSFKLFLENICLKYKEFLWEKYNPLINRFLTRKDDNFEPSKGRNKDFTTARQVLAIMYLLDELKINRKNTSLTDIAKFIHFVTGKEAGATKINDTTIYKKVKSPLGKTDKRVEQDLQFIRTYFEKLGLQSIVNKLNKEIGSKE